MGYMPSETPRKTHAVMVRLPDDLFEELEAITNEETSRAAVMRTALRAYLLVRKERKR